jgi:hypothetical protein
MILKLIVKKDGKTKKNLIIVWIQKNAEFEDDVQQLFKFFKDNIKISNKRRKKHYYKVFSENPAIMMSLFSALQEIIPEIYFKTSDPIEFKETFNLE